MMMSALAPASKRLTAAQIYSRSYYYDTVRDEMIYIYRSNPDHFGHIQISGRYDLTNEIFRSTYSPNFSTHFQNISIVKILSLKILYFLQRVGEFFKI